MIPDERQDFIGRAWKTGDVFYLDFGRHMTGYLNIHLSVAGTRQDAPAKLRFTFGEIPCEVTEPFSNYSGWISGAWLQEELLFFDRLPVQMTLARRYAFRYLKIEVIAASARFGVCFELITCDAVTSADDSELDRTGFDEKWRPLFDVSTATLRDCMQYVFEDGPKRDRRLWMGDLRLQALTNYYTYHNDGLVKRCLYLFAGTRDEKGHIMAALYDYEPPINDEHFMPDYSVLFGAALYDYYIHTGDEETTRELMPVAIDQLVLAEESISENGLEAFGSACFIDWNESLDKCAAAQGVFLYSAVRVALLAETIGESDAAGKLRSAANRAAAAAREAFWDEHAGRFVSGPDRQVSWASQVWLVLGEALPKEQCRDLMLDLFKNPPEIDMVTPYMVHHLVEALMMVHETDLAKKTLYEYWNGMVKLGADCFWEIYLPQSPDVSPYGHNMIHSYCHAWSCTPAYFIRLFC